MSYAPGSSYYAEFTTANPATGAAQNADALPAATATRNGADDATFALTVTNLATGRYRVTGTIPAGYAAGDRVQVSAAATVATVAGVGVIDAFDVAVPTDTPGTTTLLGRLTAGRAANLDDLDATVSSRSTYAGADTAGTTTLLARLTAQRATNLDYLDVAVSSRSTYAGGPVALDLTTPLLTPRALDGIPDSQLTVNDGFLCAIAAAAGKESVAGTAYTVGTPSTGTVLRTFTLDSSSAPTSRT